MTKTVTACFKKAYKTDKEGYISIRVTENRKSSYIPIGCKINQKCWNDKLKRVKANYGDGYEELNILIDKKIKDTQGDNIKAIFKNQKPQSLLRYWQDDYINLYKKNQPESLRKYQNVLNKFLQFLKEDTDLKNVNFKDLTEDLLFKFVNYMHNAHNITDENGHKRRRMHQNTITHYIQILKGVINTAIKSNQYTGTNAAFINIPMKKEHKKRTALSLEELTKLIETEIPEHLILTKHRFLFQVFSQGMRSSDLQLLKWKNIYKDHINYIMRKNKKEMDVPLNEILIDILLFTLNADSQKIVTNTKLNLLEILNLSAAEIQTEEKIVQGQNNPIYLKYLERTKTTAEKTINAYDYFMENFGFEVPVLFFALEAHKQDKKYYQRKLLDFNLQQLQKEHELLKRCMERKGDNFPKNNFEITPDIILSIKNDHLPLVENIIDKLPKIILNNKMALLFEIVAKTKLKEQYIFQFFESDINDEKKLADRLRINTVQYCKKLHQVQNICNIETSISSHVARHTFASISKSVHNFDVYVISKLLGQSSIAVTEKYLKAGFTNSESNRFSIEFAKGFKL